ncbi:MAG: hypothetical protein EKK64_05775 [Neisseriaceae bacterium]|nr:MAG: hypothetical protein EKK64_05775 [Neisseriaceae bacterium]
MGEQFSRIGTAILGLFNSIFSAVGLDTVGNLEDVFVTLWKVVKPAGQVIGFIAGAILALPLKFLFETLSFGWSIIEGIINAISGLIYALSGVIKFIKGLVKILATPFVAIFEFISALFSGFSTGNWGEAFSKAFSNIWEYVKGSIGDMFFGIVDMAWGVLKAIYGFFEAPVKWVANLFYDMWNVIVMSLEAPVKWITGYISGAWDGLMSFLSGAWDVMWAVVTWPFRTAWRIIKKFGSLVLGGIRMLANFGSWIAGIPGTIYDAVTGMFSGMGDGVADFGRGVWNAVTGLFDGFISFFEDPLGTIGKALTTAISNVGTFLYDTFSNILTSVWDWFKSWWKGTTPAKVVANTTGKLTSDEQHAKNIETGLKQNKNMEQSVNNVATEILNDPKLSIDDKIAELASKEKLYREFSNGQSKNIQNTQKTYDDEYNSWSGSMGTNSGLLQELQMSKEKAINDKASFDRQVNIFEKERKALEQMKANGGTAISEKTIATPVAATVVTSTPTVDIAKQIEQKKAESAASKTEILSPELKEMATETNEQTLLLEKMVELFQQFVDMAKPKPQKTESVDTLVGKNSNGRTPKTPNNYYRSPIGQVSQTAAKSISNTGMNNI